MKADSKKALKKELRNMHKLLMDYELWQSGADQKIKELTRDAAGARAQNKSLSAAANEALESLRQQESELLSLRSENAGLRARQVVAQRALKLTDRQLAELHAAAKVISAIYEDRQL